jgi:hypothetical protein
MKRPIVNPLSTDGSTAFAQMNPHLVSPAGFEAAFDKRVVAQLFQHAHMGNRALPFVRFRHGSTPAIAPVRDHVRFDARRLGLATNDCQITTLDGMGAELLAQVPFCFLGTSEDHQAARILVQSVHGVYSSSFSRPALSQRLWQ